MFATGDKAGGRFIEETKAERKEKRSGDSFFFQAEDGIRDRSVSRGLDMLYWLKVKGQAVAHEQVSECDQFKNLLT
nr:hypothetical protein [Escherichia coli]